MSALKPMIGSPTMSTSGFPWPGPSDRLTYVEDSGSSDTRRLSAGRAPGDSDATYGADAETHGWLTYVEHIRRPMAW